MLLKNGAKQFKEMQNRALNLKSYIFRHSSKLTMILILCGWIVFLDLTQVHRPSIITKVNTGNDSFQVENLIYEEFVITYHIIHQSFLTEALKYVGSIRIEIKILIEISTWKKLFVWLELMRQESFQMRGRMEYTAASALHIC